VAHEDSMFLLPAVLTPWNARVHVCAMNGSNKAADIEVVVDECLDYQITLRVPYVNPKYHHILEDTLMICGLDTMLTLSNIYVDLMKDSITSELIGILVPSII